MPRNSCHSCSLAAHGAQAVAQQWEKASSSLAPGQDQHQSENRDWDTQPSPALVAVAVTVAVAALAGLVPSPGGTTARGCCGLGLRGYRILGRICRHFQDSLQKPSCKSFTLRKEQGRAWLSWLRGLCFPAQPGAGPAGGEAPECHLPAWHR